MKTVKIKISSCEDCPFFLSSPYPTDDSFERPEYWWCSNPDVEQVIEDKQTEEHKHYMKIENDTLTLRKIAAYVEWGDKISIPEWCPFEND